MLRLEALQLHGFKSFVDKTKVQFPDGTTCIVGPNGCGKSNISDAICWVLGEQSAKSLRGAKMEDVIFAGSATRKPSSYAEVVMIWQKIEALNTDENTKLMIGRRLYRNGDSEYILNNAPCRLKDIQTALWDFGMGTKAYSIIEQGKIGQILNAKPHERRTLIEEAAGIAKYKARRHESELKLRSAEDNLARIDDIISEVQKQRSSLNRQVGKANRFKALQDQLREKEKQVLDFDLFHYSQQLHDVQKANQIAQKKEWQLTTEITKQDADIAKRRKELVLIETKLRDADSKLAETVRQIDLNEEHVKFNKEKREDRLKGIERATQDLAQSQDTLKSLNQKLETVEKEKKQLESQLQSVQGSDQELSQKYKLAQDKLQVTQNKKLEWQRKFQKMQLEHQNQAFALQRVQALQNQDQHDDGTDQQLKDLGRESQETEAQIKQKNATITNQESQTREIQARLGELIGKRKSAQENLDSIKRECQELERKKSRLEDRINHLERLIKDRSDVSDYLKKTLKKLDPCPALLQDEVNCQPERDNLLEWALAPLSDTLVVRQSKEQQAIERLGKRAVKTLDLTTTPQTPPEAPHPFPKLIDDIQCVDDLKLALSPIFYHHVVHQPSPDELEKYPELVFWDPQGQVRWQARFKMIRKPSQAPGFLHLKSELATCKDEWNETQKHCEEAEKSKELAEKTCQDLEQARQQQEAEKSRIEKDLVQNQSDLKRLTYIAERLQQQAKEITEKAKQKAEQREKWQVEHLSLSQSLQQLGGQKSDLEGQLRDIDQELERLTKDHQMAHSDVALFKEKQSGLKLLFERVRKEWQDTEQQKNGLNQRLNNLAQQIQTWKTDIENLSKQSTELSLSIKDQNGLRLKYKHEVTETTSSLEKKREELEACEKVHKSQLEQRDDLRAEQGRHELEGARLESKLSQSREKYMDNQGQEWDAKSIDKEALVDLETCEKLRAECQDLAMRIHAMGPVNLLALEEFSEIEERYQFLQTQQKDLIDSIAEIKSTIHKLNKICLEKFRETFEAVNEAFGRNFQELFGGGAAQLHLLDPDNGLESGIDMLIQPPGKKLQNVLLMSGGEKAMTAIALLFAIFQYKPSPFCLLDEVDAPLDEVNVTRFMRKLEEMKQHTQFIIITHHKITMSAASSLLGVTMEENGCSKIVSVKFD